MITDRRTGRPKLRNILTGLILGLSLVVALTGWSLELPAPSATDEILRHAKYLASAELTGRGVDTPGIKLARDYLASEFAKYGLKPGGDNGSLLQSFDVAVGVTVKQPTSLTLGSEPILALDQDWTPLGFSTSDKAEAPLVFAGYGITAKDYGYDDYAGIDVQGKIVLVLRYEPPPKDDKSPFRKLPNYSNHATLRNKANNARDHGAAGMILVDLNTSEAMSELLTTRSSLSRGGTSVVAAQVKRRAIEKWLDTHGVSLKALKEKIDRDEKPASIPIANATAKLQVTLHEQRERTENVIALLPGADPTLAGENIVIGAHYDHLGFGHFGAMSVNAAGQIHHGADDNASGTAVLLDLARRLSQLPTRPARTFVFVAFSAEELGLFGSRYFIDRFQSIASTKSMLNLDMVGRLREDRVTVFGARSGENLSAIVTGNARDLGLKINQSDDVGRSDHMSFYNKKIPVLHFFTGSHADYHRPSDTWEKLNIEGMARIGDLVLATALRLANAKEPMNFVSLPARPPSARAGDRRAVGTYLGSIPDYGVTSEGVRLAGVISDSPAARAGLKEGDVIVKLADAKIQNIEDLTTVLRTKKPGDQVEILILRGDSSITLTATLQARG
ncbi:MAG: peptidase [Deltaproteobacteria bacterium]|nr:peptidase [Deltaproteobacteria bacterium]